MASSLYPLFKQLLLSPGANLATANIKAVLVDSADYTYSATHQFLSDVPGAGRVATSANLASKTVTNGVFDAADVTFTGVTGDPSEALILYIDTGTATTSNLIVYIDTVSGPAALSVTPNSGDITISWSPSGIFSL
jgi:hypothetical protein